MPDKQPDELKPTRQADHPNTKNYRVLAESGIFKNGELFKKGSTIPLTDQQAKNFMNEDVLGKGNADVEPLKESK